jgi:hypothetical protein
VPVPRHDLKTGDCDLAELAGRDFAPLLVDDHRARARDRHLDREHAALRINRAAQVGETV